MMWYGEMYAKLLDVERQMAEMNIGEAKRDLRILMDRIKTEGIVINAKLEGM